MTTLDCVRAEKFVHEITGAPVGDISIPVIGGHAGTTILPLFSQDKAASTIPAADVPELDKKAQNGRRGGWRLPLRLSLRTFSEPSHRCRTQAPSSSPPRRARAPPRSRWASRERGWAAPFWRASRARRPPSAYVASNVTELPYFASKVTFGEKGVETVHPLGDLSPHEQARSPEVTRDHPRLPERGGHRLARVSSLASSDEQGGGSRRSRPSSRRRN